MNKEEYRAELSKILYMLAEVLRDNMSDALIDGWLAVMASEKVSIEEIKAAAVEVMKTREYNKLPTPAVFLEIVRPRVDPRALAEAQADIVLHAVRSKGPHNKPTFEDPITTQLMSKRWPWFDFASNLETEKVKWWRKEFSDAYCWTKKAGPHALPAAEHKVLTDGEN